MNAKSLFWSLPYGFRRNMFKTFRKEEFIKYNQLFTTRDADGVIWNRMKELKFIFIHIPKTGGLSLTNMLLGCNMNKHLPAKGFQLFMTEKEFNEFFKFAIVRNPWDRLVSAYLFLKKGGVTDKDLKFRDEHLTGIDSFQSFVKSYLVKNESLEDVYIHFVPQHKFAYDYRDQLLLDYIGRFETYTESCNYILHRLGLGGMEILKENANKTRLPYTEYYNAETKQIVAEIYKKDIELLGYEF